MSWCVMLNELFEWFNKYSPSNLNFTTNSLPILTQIVVNDLAHQIHKVLKQNGATVYVTHFYTL